MTFYYLKEDNRVFITFPNLLLGVVRGDKSRGGDSRHVYKRGKGWTSRPVSE